MSAEPIDLVFVGGFLGAGKTSLLHAAARVLRKRGRRVGIVTNDQAPQLFDTAVLGEEGPVAEVSGSCFCCDFEGLMRAVAELRDAGVDCILAEPVGSCTDLSATLIQPIKDLHRGTLRVAPLTVLADPDRLLEVMSGDSGLHEATAYVYRLQLEEADQVLLSRADAVPADDAAVFLEVAGRHFPDSPVSWVSSVDGMGIGDWLDVVLGGGPAGERLLDVDYDRYALGEAVLGWLNATIWMEAADAEATSRLIAALGAEAVRLEAPIGHVKALLSGEGFSVSTQLTRLGQAPKTAVSGTVSGSGTLVLNARVQCDPQVLLDATHRALSTLGEGSYEVISLDCFSPGYPRPTHRYGEVV